MRYDGYVIDVPANWPVYRLARDPSRCVRYDQHAVYLGTPGANQDCPAHLVGHVATVSLEPAAPAQAPVAGPLWHVAAPAMGAARGLWRAGGVLLQDPQDQAFRAILHNPGLTVDATYAAHADLVAQIIGSIRRTAATDAAAAGTTAARTTAAGTAATGAAAADAAAADAAAADAAAADAAAAGAALGGRAGVTATSAVAWPSQAELAAAARRARRHHSRLHFGRRHRRRRRRGVRADPIRGFDACTAPSLRVMRAWRPFFGAVNIYIGGPEAACGYGNLSPAWIRAATRMGWALIPTYVGRQAPCSSFRDRITLGHARAQGEEAALDAIRLARSLGLRRGAPLYDDMEHYNPRNGVCRRQVLSFLNGWTRKLHARGYRSGVYSSASSGARDLGAVHLIYGQRLAKPNSIWFALWNDRANIQGTPYLSPSWWPNDRIKQYQGPHRLRLAGATLSIDSDMVGGAVYR